MVHSVLEKSLKMLEFGIKTSRPLKVLDNRYGAWKYVKIPEKSLNLNLANFAFVDIFEASTCMHVTSTWKQYLISLCLLTYLISVTLQCKFWMSASGIWLFVDNFGAWKMQFGSLKVREKYLNFVLGVCYEPCLFLFIRFRCPPSP